MESVLALDTSSTIASVALLTSGGTVVSEEGEAQVSHHQELSRLVELVLKRGETDVTSIRRILIGTGPGSFTGLRIGYGFVQGLSFKGKIPVHQVSTFDAYALSDRSGAARVAAIADAGRGEIFGAVYERRDSELMEIAPLKIAAPQEIFSALESGVIVAAPGTKIPESEFVSKHAAQIAARLLEVFSSGGAQTGSRVLDPFHLSKLSELRPWYVRDVAARTLRERAVYSHFK